VRREALVLLEAEHVIEIGERHALHMQVAVQLEAIAMAPRMEVEAQRAHRVAAVALDGADLGERDGHPVGIEDRVALELAEPEAVEYEVGEVEVPGHVRILEAALDAAGHGADAFEGEARER